MLQTNKEKLTKEFCRGKRLVFYPKTAEEAAFIQRRLFDMGYRWPNGSEKIMGLEYCVKSGMLLTSEGVVYNSPSPRETESGLLCSVGQFDENYLPPETLFLLEQFNKLSAQIRDLAREVAEIKEQLQPQKLDKPAPKKLGNESP